MSILLSRRLPLALVFLVLAGWAAPRAAAQAVTPEAADSLYRLQQWPEAARAYEALTMQTPVDGRAWYRLGVARHFQKQYAPALDAYRKALDHSFPTTYAAYNMAAALAPLGQMDEAFEWLEKAVAGGLNQPAQIEQDDDFAALRADARYGPFLDKVRRLAEPCAHDSLARQFDYWVGEWNVFNPQGQQAGTSSVQNILGGCVIFENWTDTFGNSGKSFNTYNHEKGAWQQTWISDKGTVSEFFGGVFADGALRFHLTAHDPNGAMILRRLTFYDLGPDRVRQWGETSRDGGRTWTTDYDLTYVRKQKTATSQR